MRKNTKNAVQKDRNFVKQTPRTEHVQVYCTVEMESEDKIFIIDYFLLIKSRLNRNCIFLYNSQRPARPQYTAKILWRKFEKNIPRWETARPQPQFLHSYICARFIYFHDWSAYLAAAK
jgi:hypothetical protein